MQQGTEDTKHRTRQVVHSPQAAVAGAEIQPACDAECRQGIPGSEVGPSQRLLQCQEGTLQLTSRSEHTSSSHPPYFLPQTCCTTDSWQICKSLFSLLFITEQAWRGNSNTICLCLELFSQHTAKRAFSALELFSAPIAGPSTLSCPDQPART